MSWLQRIKTLRRKTIEWQHALIPERIREKFDAEEYSITQFIKLTSSQVESTDRVLDAGAGACAYKSFFEHKRLGAIELFLVTLLSIHQRAHREIHLRIEVDIFGERKIKDVNLNGELPCSRASFELYLK